MGNCGGRPEAGHPGLGLDRVASQPDAEDHYPLYRLANYRKTGQLLDAYNTGGAKEVDRMIKEQLRLFTYNNGEGQVITVPDYMRWKHSQNGEVIIAVEKDDEVVQEAQAQLLQEQSRFLFVEEHNVCWSLEYRGALGETLLHVLLICDSKLHNRIAKMLIKAYPRLAMDIVEGEEFFGLSALHLAIAYGHDDVAQLLVQCGANVIQRATGRFFWPTDQQTNVTKKRTNYEGLAYFGEFPLAWAACFDNETMYNYLIDRDANPNMQDTFGNTVLHMLVIQEKLGMYGYALRHPKVAARNDLTNAAGLTPLTLACTLGRNNIFREMLELSSVEFWRYSNITCSAYPLNALDTILPDGKTNWKSALMIILRGQSDQHLDMLEGGVVQRLLEDKWKTYARRYFLRRLVILFQHLLTLSIAVYLRPTCASNDRGDVDNPSGELPQQIPVVCNESLYDTTDVQSIVRYCSEIASCVSSAYYTIVQQGQEILAQGVVTYFKTLTQSPAKFIFLIANLLILLCIPCRFLHLRRVEDVLLSLALPGSWFFLMFFAGAVRLTGPFVTMIYSMITGDMVRFGIIYLIVLLGFSQAFYFLFKQNTIEDGDDGANDFDSYFSTWMALFHMTLGAYQYENFGKAYYHVLTRFVFVVFMVMVPILLLNMLIAMMGNTYTQVISKSEKEFVKQWANIVLTLERSLSQEKAASFLDAYCIDLKSPSGEEKLKGLMVIKSKNKTKARQRKGAVMNWKRVGKKVITKLRDVGCKGEDLMAKLRAIQGDNPPPEDDDEATPLVGHKPGLNEALSQLAQASGLDFSVLSPVVGGGVGNAEPNPSKPEGNPHQNDVNENTPQNDMNENIPQNDLKQSIQQNDLNENLALDNMNVHFPPTYNEAVNPSNALTAMDLQHDIDLDKKAAQNHLSSTIAVRTGIDNPAFIQDEEKIAAELGAANVFRDVKVEPPPDTNTSREDFHPSNTVVHSTTKDVRVVLSDSEGTLDLSYAVRQVDVNGKPPGFPSKKKKKKNKSRKTAKVEDMPSNDPTISSHLPPLLPPVAATAEESGSKGAKKKKRKKNKKRRADDTSEIPVSDSNGTVVRHRSTVERTSGIASAEAPLPFQQRVIKKWSTTSIVSMTTLLGSGSGDEDGDPL